MSSAAAATGLSKTKLVELLDDEEEGNASAPKRLRSAVEVMREGSANASIQTQIPEDIESDTLYKLCGYTPSAKSWKCFVNGCVKPNGSNSDRLFEHFLDRHMRIPHVVELVNAAVKGNSRTKAGGYMNGIDGAVSLQSNDPTQPSLPVFFEAKEEFQNKVVDALLLGGMPPSTAQAPWFRMVLKAVGDYQRRRTQAFDPEFVIDKRTAFGQRMDRRAKLKMYDYRKRLLDSAPLLPFTLGSDGRSNIRNDPLTASMIITLDGNLPVGTDNAGSLKKQASYIADLAKKYSNATDVFGGRVFGFVQDGAAACIRALHHVEDEICLIPIRCQSHAIALDLKNILTKVFPDLLQKVQHVIGFVRGRQRVSAILKAKLSTLSVVRVVETRFNTHIMAMLRLLQLATPLQNLLKTPEYISFLNENPSDDAILFRAIVKDAQFWEMMDFVCQALGSVVVGLKAMDSSAVRAVHAWDIWEKIESGIILAVCNPTFVDVPFAIKIALLERHQKEREKAMWPVIHAAYVLNTKNVVEIRRLKATENLEDKERWKLMTKDTKAIIATVVKRQVMVLKKASVWGPELQGAFDVRIADVLRDYGLYTAGLEPFNTPPNTMKDAMSYWINLESPLASVALKILYVAVTTSDVERLHKRYGQIHSSPRASMLHGRVDSYVVAQVGLRHEHGTGKVPPFNLEHAFRPLTEQDEEVIIQWGMDLKETLRNASMDQLSNFEGSDAAGVVPLVTVSTNPSSSDEVDSDPEIVEGDFSDDDEADEDENEANGELVDEPLPRRSARACLPTARYLAALMSLNPVAGDIRGGSSAT
jgi:hypothetical protein